MDKYQREHQRAKIVYAIADIEQRIRTVGTWIVILLLILGFNYFRGQHGVHTKKLLLDDNASDSHVLHQLLPEHCCEGENK